MAGIERQSLPRKARSLLFALCFKSTFRLMSLLHLPDSTEGLAEEELVFIKEDLAELPEGFPHCVIKDGKIARADGLPLEWEQYELLDENFPATLTETGELQMSPRPRPAHETKAATLYKLLDRYLTCESGGQAFLGPELRIAPYRRTIVPDLMFFRNPKPEWDQAETTHIDQIPDLVVEIMSPSNKGKKWEDNVAFYREAAFPEIWFFRLDGTVEIWRQQPSLNAIYEPGEIFSTPLFPGLSIDPGWIRKYPDEIRLIDQFSPQIRVLPNPYKPELTKKAYALAERISTHFGLVPSTAEFLSQLRHSAVDQPGDSPSQGRGLKH
jgi:Uma2 family endonuclease